MHIDVCLQELSVLAEKEIMQHLHQICSVRDDVTRYPVCPAYSWWEVLVYYVTYYEVLCMTYHSRSTYRQSVILRYYGLLGGISVSPQIAHLITKHRLTFSYLPPVARCKFHELQSDIHKGRCRTDISYHVLTNLYLLSFATHR